MAARDVAARVHRRTAGPSEERFATSGKPAKDGISADSAEIEVQLDITTFMTQLAEAVGGATDDLDRRRRIGALALASDTVPEPLRRAAVAARLPVCTWPARDLRIPAVDAATGELVVFRPDSGVALTDAVAASCAVPGVWPPVTIGVRRFIDGGARSGTNADLADGTDIVVIITPAGPEDQAGWAALAAELATLAPARAHVIGADPASVAAFGTNPLSPATRRPSALAGREVGRSQVEPLRALFG